MDDKPDTLVTPHTRKCVQYVNAQGKLLTVYVTVYPARYAEGAERAGSALPRDYLEFD